MKFIQTENKFYINLILFINKVKLNKNHFKLKNIFILLLSQTTLKFYARKIRDQTGG